MKAFSILVSTSKDFPQLTVWPIVCFQLSGVKWYLPAWILLASAGWKCLPHQDQWRLSHTFVFASFVLSHQPGQAAFHFTQQCSTWERKQEENRKWAPCHGSSWFSSSSLQHLFRSTDDVIVLRSRLSLFRLGCARFNIFTFSFGFEVFFFDSATQLHKDSRVELFEVFVWLTKNNRFSYPEVALLKQFHWSSSLKIDFQLASTNCGAEKSSGTKMWFARSDSNELTKKWNCTTWRSLKQQKSSEQDQESFPRSIN